MTQRAVDPSPLIHARLAGLGSWIIIVAGIFAEFFVRSSLIVPGDATATAANLMASNSLYRAGIASEFVMLLCDVFVAGALYVVFRSVNRNLALLAAFFRLAHASIVAVNLLNTWVPLLLVGDAGYLTVFSTEQLHALALLLLEAHSYGYVIGRWCLRRPLRVAGLSRDPIRLSSEMARLRAVGCRGGLPCRRLRAHAARRLRALRRRVPAGRVRSGVHRRAILLPVDAVQGDRRPAVATALSERGVLIPVTAPTLPSCGGDK